MVSSLEQLISRMGEYGAVRFYAKRLAPNDNSKNQIYLGGDFSALNLLPHGDVYTDDSEQAGSKRDRAKASIKLAWLGEDGVHIASNATLILYPKYPEVRMSGFLLGCKGAPSDVLRVRDEGRVLVLGVAPDGKIFGFAAFADHPVAQEVNRTQWQMTGVFDDLTTQVPETSSRAVLLAELRRIYLKHWIASQKLSSDGQKKPYSARNGGGYTLEAELGVSANGYAEPDFLGWEIKQYGVTDFVKFRPKSPVTLMTPEPTDGIYRSEGVGAFIARYGYPDKSGKPDRLNFGGVYACDRSFHHETGLRLELEGFNQESGKLTDFEGAIHLKDRDGENAASWAFKGLMQHWNRKHSLAAYVPSLFRTPPPEYSYGPQALLCEQTDFLLFLRAVAAGLIYYDPGIKVEGVSTMKPKIKRRSQFRVGHRDLESLYQRSKIEKLL